MLCPQEDGRELGTDRGQETLRSLMPGNGLAREDGPGWAFISLLTLHIPLHSMANSAAGGEPGTPLAQV